MVFARRADTSAVFTAVLEPVRPGEAPPAEVELLSEAFPLTVRLTWEDGTEDRVTLHAPREITTAGQQMRSDRMRDQSTNTQDSRVSYVRRKNGEVVGMAGLDAQRVEADGMGLFFAPQTSFSMRRTGTGWTLTHTGERGIQITLSPAFEGAQIRKGAAERALMTKEHEGKQTFVLEDDQTYTISAPAEAAR